MKEKKGDSLIVSYVLLIVIVLGLGILVYAFLKLYLPSKAQECPSDVSLSIESVNCVLTPPAKLNIRIRNSGLFNIDAIFVRMASPDREVRPQINRGNEAIPGSLQPIPQTLELSYDLAGQSINAGPKIVEIQPAVFKKRLITCKNIVTESVNC